MKYLEGYLSQSKSSLLLTAVQTRSYFSTKFCSFWCVHMTSDKWVGKVWGKHFISNLAYWMGTGASGCFRELTALLRTSFPLWPSLSFFQLLLVFSSVLGHICQFNTASSWRTWTLSSFSRRGSVPVACTSCFRCASGSSTPQSLWLAPAQQTPGAEEQLVDFR